MRGLLHTIAHWETPLYAAQQQVLRALGVALVPTARDRAPGSDDYLLVPRTIPAVGSGRTELARSPQHLARVWRRWFRVPVQNWLIVLGGPVGEGESPLCHHRGIGLTVASSVSALVEEASEIPDLLPRSVVESIVLPQVVHEIQFLLHELNGEGPPSDDLLVAVRDCALRGIRDGMVERTERPVEALEPVALEELLRAIRARCKQVKENE